MFQLAGNAQFFLLLLQFLNVIVVGMWTCRGSGAQSPFGTALIQEPYGTG